MCFQDKPATEEEAHNIQPRSVPASSAPTHVRPPIPQSNSTSATPTSPTPQSTLQQLYRQLNFSQKQIRLLELDYHDGDPSAPVSCRLNHCSLETAPPYEALSYVWGSTINAQPLRVGQYTLSVTQNLDIALRHLRRSNIPTLGSAHGSSRSRLVWIDAICINQSDTNERNQQVRLMFSIYRRASRLLVWLGEKGDNSDAAIDLILHIAANNLTMLQRQIPLLRFTESEQAIVNRFQGHEAWNMSILKQHGSSGGEHLNPQDPPEWIAFQKLMQRPWWYRIWVVQELAATGDKNAIVGCGSRWTDWNFFIMAYSTISDAKEQSFMQRLRRLGKDADLIAGISAVSIRAPNFKKLSSMMDLLHYTISKQATLPIDRIYALLGFIPSHSIPIDYQLPPQAVFKLFVKTYIHQMGTLTPLIFNRFPKNLALPSWTPDFSCEFKAGEYNISMPLGFYGADGNVGHGSGQPTPGCILDPSDSEDELTVFGIYYDRPSYIGRAWQGSAEERDRLLFTLLDESSAAVEDGIEVGRITAPRYGDPYEALWRTLIWDANPQSRFPATPEYGEYYRELTQSHHVMINVSTPPPPPGVDMDEYLAQFPRTIPPEGQCRLYYESLVRHFLNRRFFITSNGSLGCGPLEMSENDLVCVLCGFKSPVILRHSLRVEGCFEWIGFAYVHGIMFGESIPTTRGKVNEFKLV